MRWLRKGMHGKDVAAWQLFLRGLNLYKGKVDKAFGSKTYKATRAFQRKYRDKFSLSVDGIVGNQTYGAAQVLGFCVFQDEDNDDKYGINWPPQPDNLKPLSFSQRQRKFGKIEYVPAPTNRNPEAIYITNNWIKDNIVKIQVPQLKGVRGASRSGKIFWHRKGEEQLLGLFQAWEDEGLSDLILTWAGSWVPRFIRGSRTTLSNHAHGIAFDINAPWNGLGRQPALVGKKGSVRELVDIAVEYGFFWGGWFGMRGGGGRSDGMHFELNKILS